MVIIEGKSKFISNSNIVVCTVQALFLCVVLKYCIGTGKPNNELFLDCVRFLFFKNLINTLYDRK